MFLNSKTNKDIVLKQSTQTGGLQNGQYMPSLGGPYHEVTLDDLRAQMMRVPLPFEK